MAFATLAAVNAALPGQRLEWAKTLTGSQTAGTWYSAWTVAGLPGTGVAPSSGVAGDVPTSATVGAFPFVNPASGNTCVGRMEGFHSVTASGASTQVALYDRLWQNSGIDATSTGAQTIQSSPPVSVPLTRPNANGSQVEAWWEVYVVMGANTPTVTLTYTDSAGNTGNSGSSGALAATMAVGRTGRFTLATGDTGVRSIQTWQASASFTSGTIGLVQRRRILAAPLEPRGQPTFLDALDCGLARVYDGACLELIFLPSTTSAPLVGASLFLVNG